MAGLDEADSERREGHAAAVVAEGLCGGFI